MQSLTHNGWTFSIQKSNIGTQEEIGKIEELSGVHPAPDMLFTGSSVVISRDCGFSLSFTPQDALRCCRYDSLTFPTSAFPVTRLRQLKVKNSQAWKAAAVDSNLLSEPAEVAHDWTFSTSYFGTLNGGRRVSEDEQGGTDRPPTTSKFLPLPLISDHTLPILLMDEIPLWEDELHDNGHSEFVVRVRVTDKYWYVLTQFKLRVDGVAEREIACRYYWGYEGQEGAVLAECQIKEDGRQGTVDVVRQRIVL